jgi:hypothetical protein
MRYFESEMRMAFLCLHLGSKGPAEASHLCFTRADAIYTALVEWVQANGGHPGLEARLNQLRWHLNALHSADGSFDSIGPASRQS